MIEMQIELKNTSVSSLVRKPWYRIGVKALQLGPLRLGLLRLLYFLAERHALEVTRASEAVASRVQVVVVVDGWW